MAEYVIMPKADYEAACNSIRAKTGKTDLIKSGSLSTEIDSITGGGGSSADVRYVTFMNGNTELYRKPVAVGDDCVDVYLKGLIDTPTKESTAQYNYIYYGWGASDGGAADGDILKNITEDKTVYAVFTAVVRYYTITYLDSDGVTVLKTEQLAYGSVPSYAPIKEGYELVGWTPAFSAVTGNATYTAQWEEMSVVVEEIADDWDAIIAAATDGSYATKYKVGNYKPLELNGKVHKMQIVAKNTDILADGTGFAPLTFVSRIVPDAVAFLGNSNTLQNELWSTSAFRTQYIPEKLTAYIPENILAAIKEVKKHTLGLSNGNFVEEETTEKIWVPSEREMFGTGEADGVIYTAYVSGDLSKVKYDAYSDREAYALRSKIRYSLNGYNRFAVAAVDGYGEYDADGFSSTWAAAPLGFCI